MNQTERNRLHPLEGIERQNAVITGLEVTLLTCEYPPEEQLLVVRNIWWKSDSIIVQIHTDQGVVGLGGASRYSGGGCCLPVKQYLEVVVGPSLIGKNPFDLDRLAWGGATSIGRCAWAGAEAALFDLIGKLTGRPVYDLLAVDAEPNTRLRVYASAGVKYAWYDRPEQLVEEAAAMKELGFTAYKFRPGTEWEFSGMTVDKFIPWLERVRAAVGDGFDLALELRPWSLEEALQLAPVLEELRFTWFEEPMSRQGEDAFDRYLRLQEALPTVMISGGESCWNSHELKEWVDRGAIEMPQPDAGRIGLMEAWRVVRMAASHGRPFCPHNWGDGSCTLANAALVAASPNALMLEQFETWDPLRTEIFTDPLVVVDGYMDLPARPGFGMELAPDLERFARSYNKSGGIVPDAAPHYDAIQAWIWVPSMYSSIEQGMKLLIKNHTGSHPGDGHRLSKLYKHLSDRHKEILDKTYKAFLKLHSYIPHPDLQSFLHQIDIGVRYENEEKEKDQDGYTTWRYFLLEGFPEDQGKMPKVSIAAMLEIARGIGYILENGLVSKKNEIESPYVIGRIYGDLHGEMFVMANDAGSIDHVQARYYKIRNLLIDNIRFVLRYLSPGDIRNHPYFPSTLNIDKDLLRICKFMRNLDRENYYQYFTNVSSGTFHLPCSKFYLKDASNEKRDTGESQ